MHLFLAFGIILFTAKRLLRYLQFFQQEEYNTERFRHWWFEKRAFDRRGSLIAGGAALLSILLVEASHDQLRSAASPTILAVIALLVLALTEEDPRGTGKISLKMTPRAKRIYGVAVVAAALVALAMAILLGRDHLQFIWLLCIPYFQLHPLFLIIGKLALDPDERRRQNGFLREAKENFARVAPYVVAITGSFGKTSVKAILGNLLEVTLGPTFWPPKSINTPMGVTRELRERLKLGHKYAVMEMGAYNVGSIERLCAITPPQAGIVTAVGLMHLERFGSPENIYRAKSELPRAVPQDGILVCNGDNAGSRKMATEFPKRITLLYGLDRSAGPLDVYATDVEISPSGTRFIIHWKSGQYPSRTKMHGAPALSNILAAFTMCVALGADPGYVAAAVANLEPFDNRLEVKRVGEFLQINDAYNSNPDGFRAALDVLKALPARRRILMTPGMIELGDQQEGENRAIGEYAASVCDIVILVGETNRAALQSGLLKGGFPAEQILIASSRSDAFRILGEVRTTDDVTLIENDLPDLYEPEFRL